VRKGRRFVSTFCIKKILAEALDFGEENKVDSQNG